MGQLGSKERRQEVQNGTRPNTHQPASSKEALSLEVSTGDEGRALTAQSPVSDGIHQGKGSTSYTNPVRTSMLGTPAAGKASQSDSVLMLSCILMRSKRALSR